MTPLFKGGNIYKRYFVSAFYSLLVSTLSAQPFYYSDFLYFTDSEISGGGPYTGTMVNFGSGDILDGFVHTNGTINLSEYGCPQFTGFVEAVNGIEMGNCAEDQVFLSGFNGDADPFYLPTTEILDTLKTMANYTFVSDSMIGRSGLTDTLIMTKLYFHAGGFTVDQWPYIIPPVAGDTSNFNGFEYYHNHTYGDTCLIDGFHHYDFPPPSDTAKYILYNQTFTASTGIVHIQGGQVLVSGNVNGQFVVITDNKTFYQNPGWDEFPYYNGFSDYVYNNIWIIDDLIYADSDPNTGEVTPGSSNRIGLVSGANIIIANTRENGGGNRAFGGDVSINAALIALNGSFTSQYWQNTCNSELSNPNSNNPEFSKGDGRGPTRIFGSNPYQTGMDNRGTVNFWGSVVQKKRGFMMRNNPGPYSISGIGYYKNYRYDPNLLITPPPGFDILINSLNLHMGDVDGDRVVEHEDGIMILNYLIGLESFNARQYIESNTYLDAIISGMDASITFQYMDQVVDTLPIYVDYEAYQATGELHLYDVTGSPGQVIDIPIYLENASNIYSFQLAVNFNSAIFSFDSTEFTPSDLLSDFATVKNTTSYSIQIAGAGSQPVDLDEALLTLHLVVNDELTVGSSTEISVQSLRLNNSVEPQSAVCEVIGTVATRNDDNIPISYNLNACYPNPFNPTTTIQYDLPEPALVSLTIFNQLGQPIRTLVNGEKAAGYQAVVWDGRNNAGQQVGTGIYFYQMRAGQFSQTRKMLLLK